MFCESCGEENSNGNKFCTKCGKALTGLSPNKEELLMPADVEEIKQKQEQNKKLANKKFILRIVACILFSLGVCFLTLSLFVAAVPLLILCGVSFVGAFICAITTPQKNKK